MPWKKGQSGNPTGRKPGTKNRKLELFRSHDAKLQKKVLDMAMDGDPAAIKIIADRLWPRLRVEAPPIDLDVGQGDITEQARAAVDAALSGEITTDVLRDLLMSMYSFGRLIELTELEERLRALEQRDEQPPWRAEQKLPFRSRRKRREPQH